MICDLDKYADGSLCSSFYSSQHNRVAGKEKESPDRLCKEAVLIVMQQQDSVQTPEVRRGKENRNSPGSEK